MDWIHRLKRPKTGSPAVQTDPTASAPARSETQETTIELDIAPNDPLLAYILNAPGVIVVDDLKLDSPALRKLKAAGVHLAAPLVSQGELIGLLNLGPRLSEADYSSDDLRQPGPAASEPDERLLAEFSLPSQPGGERQAMQRVTEAVEPLALEASRLERLKTAVAETIMNAMEHGNRYQEDLPVNIQVRVSPALLTVRITDYGGGEDIPQAATPDLDAKLAGLQSPRGWGLFLIKSMVDDMHVSSDGAHHTVELVFNLKGDGRDPE